MEKILTPEMLNAIGVIGISYLLTIATLITITIIVVKSSIKQGKHLIFSLLDGIKELNKHLEQITVENIKHQTKNDLQLENIIQSQETIQQQLMNMRLGNAKFRSAEKEAVNE